MPGSASRSTLTTPLPVRDDDVANKAYVDGAVTGEDNTISADGGGLALTATVTKVGVDLRVRSIAATSPLNVAQAGDLITMTIDGLVNADIAAAAAIAVNKLAALTVTKDVITDGSGFLATKSRNLHIIKPTDETVTNSTVLQDDDALLFSALANTEYGFLLVVFADAASNADLKIAFTLPAGASGDWDPTSTVPVAVDDITVGRLGAQVAVGTVTMFVLHGRITIAGTAGTCNLQFAQFTQQATVLTVHNGSFLTVWEE